MVRSVVLSLTLTLAACSPPEVAPRAKGTGMPRVEKAAGAYLGVVDEVLHAQSYTYLRVGSAWAVTLKQRDLAVGNRVRVRRFGTKEHFTSKHLQRTFDHLDFAMVTKEET